MDTMVTHWIGGERVAGSGQRSSPVFDPATGDQIGLVGHADDRDVDGAVSTARQAFLSWGRTSASARAQVMFDYRLLLREHQRELADVVSREHGKTITDALGEVQRGLEVVEYAAGIGALTRGEYSRRGSSTVDTMSVREPLGVCIGITPFNFPLMVPVWMYAMAIACGNAFVLKPSEQDPSVSLLLAELLQEAGLPDGVFNVLQGDRPTVESLLRHPDVDAVSFVGSTAVAQAVHRTATHEGKRAQALGGAKNHMVVMPDADMDVAADAAVSAGYGSAGERCMAVSVVVAVGDAGDELVPRIVDRVGKLRVGPGDHEDSDMGPLISARHLDRVRTLVRSGVDEGGRLIVDGRGLTIDGHERGFFLGPCLFDGVSTDMTIYREEIFGPVLSVVRAESLDEAVNIVNRNPYGNGAAIFTIDGRHAHQFETDVAVGMICVNVPIPVPISTHGFGGWKQSSFGSHGLYGPDAAHFYTRQKSVVSRWPRRQTSHVDLGFEPGS
jgi:malonate-semialdehyde dehydrogenase (acetylating)/methylmalonate-semialdehyde dehydrogenase